MKAPTVDEPVKLGGSFWLLYLCLMVPSLWLLRPWSWDAPIYSAIAGVILPPFLAGIVLYSFALFTFSVISNFQGQTQALVWFLAALVGPTVFLVMAWHFSGYQNLPSICAFVASIIGYSILCIAHRRRSNQPPQRNAGSRPSADDSPASETQSSLGPRG